MAIATRAAPPPAWVPRIRGENAPIVIICDSPSPQAQTDKLPCDWEDLKFFSKHAKEYGFKPGDVAWVQLCPTIPKDIMGSAAKKWAHVQPYIEQVLEQALALGPSLIVTMGELATRAVVGRAVKITKMRGIPLIDPKTNLPVLPMLSPGYVRRIPDNTPAFQADLNTLARIKDAAYDIGAVAVTATDYKWVFDFDEIADQIGKVISVDTEGHGLQWFMPDSTTYVIQISPRPGVAWCFPVGKDYCERWFPDFTEEQRLALFDRLKTLLEDGATRKIGFNIKYDHMMLRKFGINVQGWLHDGQLLGFCVDENMLRKDLDEMVRVFVPDMAGYADEFSRTTNKDDMLSVPPYDERDAEGNITRHGMLNYAGGDPDATFRLCRSLDARLRQDPKQLNCYRKIMMPAIMVFANSVERYGMLVDRDVLNEIEQQLITYIDAKYRELIRLVPAAIRRKHLKEGLSFGRPNFMLDILFSKEGFNLKPTLWTKSTKDIEDISKRTPQVGKDHLTYFVSDRRATVARFCSELIAFGAAKKMLSTYVGNEEEDSGFHKYIAPNGNIYPSYMLHRTVTGRTASAHPNGQNFVKRSPKNGPDWATMYQGIFLARPGWKLVNCDLSQIEVRLVAWMANEKTMLRIYREGGDIHTTTAKAVLGFTDAQWDALSDKDRKLNRFKAKAVVFGLIYGMSAGGFQVYAKTDYGLDLTEQEAIDIRNKFFELYSDLPSWHDNMKDFVNLRGYVRAMHGAVRHCPGVNSSDRAIVSGTERQAINAPIQRMGSDLGLIAMIRFASQMDPTRFRLIGFVHDALVLECREGHEEEGASYLKWVMETTPLERWFGLTAPIPILADAEIAEGQSSATLKERPDIQAIKPPDWNDNEDEVIRQFMLSNPWLDDEEEEHVELQLVAN